MRYHFRTEFMMCLDKFLARPLPILTENFDGLSCVPPGKKARIVP
jgi:hypothetical protein